MKTTLTTMGHLLAKELNFCLSDIIRNSNALKCQCLKHFKIFNSCFFNIQHVVTRNKFSLFRSWKLETLTLLTTRENLYTNLLPTIISSLVNKNYYYIVILFLCYVFPFISKGLATLKYPCILN